MSYPADIDPECIQLCDTLNALPGIRTLQSCCGHGREPYRVWFAAETVEAMRPLLTRIHNTGWHVETAWASGSDTIYFMLEGPSSAPAGADLAIRLQR